MQEALADEDASASAAKLAAPPSSPAADAVVIEYDEGYEDVMLLDWLEEQHAQQRMSAADDGTAPPLTLNRAEVASLLALLPEEVAAALKSADTGTASDAATADASSAVTDADLRPLLLDRLRLYAEEVAPPLLPRVDSAFAQFSDRPLVLFAVCERANPGTTSAYIDDLLQAIVSALAFYMHMSGFEPLLTDCLLKSPGAESVLPLSVACLSHRMNTCRTLAASCGSCC